MGLGKIFLKIMGMGFMGSTASYWIRQLFSKIDIIILSYDGSLWVISLITLFLNIFIWGLAIFLIYLLFKLNKDEEEKIGWIK